MVATGSAAVVVVSLPLPLSAHATQSSVAQTMRHARIMESILVFIMIFLLYKTQNSAECSMQGPASRSAIKRSTTNFIIRTGVCQEKLSPHPYNFYI